MKLLAPAGNFECLKSAVFSGADEVYLGVNEFNARNNVDGFTLSSLKDAVDFAHLYKVRVHLALNILFTDKELQDAVNVAITAYNLGVDAFIIQDLGLAKILSENYPQMELHASTQMGIHNLEGVRAISKFNFKRVVLARETPLSEIRRIKDNSNVEIEYFAHGALCVSFSGNCYLSSKLFGASGNRGRCKQLCRLPYNLKKDGKCIKKGYLLSAKDFNLIKRLDDLEKAGVTALKIEGRARRAFYVATVTKEYKKAINGKGSDENKLALAFNRGYTEGYFNGNGDIISKLQSHVGVPIGKIYKIERGKSFNKVYFSSNRVVCPKSTFKVFSNGKEQAVLTAYDLKRVCEGNYYLTTTHKLEVGNYVNLISDFEMEQAVLERKIKLPLKIELFLEEEKPIKAKIKVDEVDEEVLGEVCQPAKNQPINKEQLIENFSKSEYFFAELTFEKLDKVFMSKTSLNAFRRSVFDKAYEQLIQIKRPILNEYVHVVKPLNCKALTGVEIISHPNEQSNAKNLIYSPECYSVSDVKAFILRCEKEGKTAYLDTPNFALNKDVELLKEVIRQTGIKIVANNYYALSLGAETITGAGLNVYNTECANFYGKEFLTAEEGLFKPIKVPLMTFRHCPIKAHLKNACEKCRYEDGYTFTTDDGREFKLKRKKLSTCTFYLED